jgi:hypothetical protein
VYGTLLHPAAFVAANSCGPANGDDGTWNEWDWELQFDEFLEVRLYSGYINAIPRLYY